MKSEFTIYELVEALKDGTLTIDFSGHTFNATTVDDVIEVINYSCIELYEKHNDDGLFDRDKNHKYGFKTRVIKDEQYPVGGFMSGAEFFCWGCGHRHRLVFLDETTLGFQRSRYVDTDGNKLPLGKSIKTTEPCEFPYGQYEKFQGVINIPSGKVLVANHISENHDDEHYDPIYNPREHSGIQSHREQFELMEHLLKEKNVFYGQTGNTSGTVFKSDNEIVMCDEWYFSNDKEEILKQFSKEEVEAEWDENDEYGWELQYIPDDMTEVGSICMGVWRYMITDHQQAIDGNYKISSEHVVVEVEPGQYKVEHLYYNRNLKAEQHFKMTKL